MFRYSIRELMLVTFVVGFGVAWWIEHRQSARLRAEMVMYEDSSKLMEALLDQALDEATDKAIARGEPVMIPIYSDNSPRVRQLIYSEEDQ